MTDFKRYGGIRMTINENQTSLINKLKSVSTNTTGFEQKANKVLELENFSDDDSTSLFLS